MTGRFLSPAEQTELGIEDDNAVWHSKSAESSEPLKMKIQSLSEWIRKVPSKMIYLLFVVMTCLVFVFSSFCSRLKKKGLDILSLSSI